MPRSTKAQAAGTTPTPVSRLVVVFGDQLDADAPPIAGLDPARDAVVMLEVAGESRHIPSHIQRTVLFLSAMRNFAAALRARGVRVHYVALDDPANTHDFRTELDRAVHTLAPAELACTHPGEWRILDEVRSWNRRFGLPVTVHADRHFIATPEEFRAWADARASLVMEFFYREQRRRTGYLVDARGRPEGGEWNFDKQNRKAFGARGPDPKPPPPRRFEPDAVTLDVIRAVRTVLPDLPGRLPADTDFAWPVTRAQALAALDDFITHRLARFGDYEDAMWSTEPVAYHSTLSPALNLKLLNPRECCEAAIAAYRAGAAPLPGVEGFVRQIIGWREFIRGVYWLEGPDYADRNGLDQHGNLPWFYWTGGTDMACLRTCVNEVLDRAYGHHIQRLMVTGNFALLAGVSPRAVRDWYLGMYADGVDWVTAPNVVGMVMHADRREHAAPGVTGLVGTKPYAASGRYIERMSNYCRSCRYDPGRREGPRACPVTVLYWDFLARNRARLGSNRRMAMMFKNLDALPRETLVRLTHEARELRSRLGVERTPGSAPGAPPA
jgi:deoxyribodipyrimidine photolyase-related protein